MAAQSFNIGIAVRDQLNVDKQTCTNYRNAVNHFYHIVTTNHVYDFVAYDANRIQLRYISKELRCLTAGVKTRELGSSISEDPSQTSAVAKACDRSGALSVGAIAFVVTTKINLVTNPRNSQVYISTYAGRAQKS